jgi:hypothetical protein
MSFPTISGGIFDFTSGGYTPPTWSGSIYDFGGLSDVKQTWIDSDFVYAVYADGLNIYEITSEEYYAYITISGGFNTIWGNEDRIFLGSTISGVYYIEKSCISGSIESPYDLATCLGQLTSLMPYETSSQYIQYLHGYNDTLLVITDVGVDVMKLDPHSFKSTATISGVQKGFMTPSGRFYYTISGSEWSLDRLNNHLCDWTTPDYSWITGSGVLASGITLNDLYVDGNFVYVATSSGVYKLEEGSNRYAIYYIEE